MLMMTACKVRWFHKYILFWINTYRKIKKDVKIWSFKTNCNSLKYYS